MSRRFGTIFIRGVQDPGGTPRDFFPIKPSLRVTVTLKDFGQRPIGGASTLVDYKKCFHTSQTGPPFCGFYSHFTGPSKKGAFPPFSVF
jgi:hypothetical protein